MAYDSVGYTEGSGKDIATDTVASKKFQVIKVDIGATTTSTPLVAGQTTAANSLPVVLASDQTLALPSGAATSAKQDTGNTSVASIDTKTPALGQALAAASVPIVLTAAQLTTLTPPAAISGFATSAKQDTGNTSLASIDGKITAVNTGAVVIASGTLTAVTAITNALPAGTNAIGKLAANSGVDIGDVDVTSVPTDPFGANADAASATGSISAKLRFIAGTGIPITGTVAVGSHAVTNAGTFTTQSAITAASGSISSGAIASGAIASGAVASGAVASGAFASGALASGSIAAGAVAAGATSFVKLEDVASADGDAGVACLAVRKNTAASTSGTDGDYQPLITNTTGHLWVDASGQTLTVASHAVTNAGTFAVQAACAGDVASGSSDSGNPVKAGAVAHTAAPTAVTDGQRVNLIADKVGKLITVGAIRDLKGNQQTSVSNTTSETTIVTAVASTFLDVYGIILANTGASTTKVSIRDDTAGTVRMIIEVPTLETRGFMLPVDSAVCQTAVNKNWTATAATATTALEVTVFYVKNI